MVTKRMNATLLELEPASVFRKEPSPEVDEAWIQIAEINPIAISGAAVTALGKDPKRAVKWPESFGFGSDAYAARLDVFHQIHCLDAIRREVYFDYYYGAHYPGGFNTTPEMHKLHLSHCIYYLLQNIMCTANSDVYTHFWTDTFSHPFPDFNINHRCRDFDTVLDWQRVNGVDNVAFTALKKPDDYGPAANMVRKFKEIHNWYQNHKDDGGPGEVIA